MLIKAARTLLQGACLTALLYSHALATAPWRVLFYMDATDALADMAIKNITDMVRGAPAAHVTWYVQLHAYGSTALRYQVTRDGLVFQEEVALSGNTQEDLMAAARWGFAGRANEHTMLIISNHGYGILDPAWNSLTKKWEVELDTLAPAATCLLEKRLTPHEQHRHKGYLFNHDSKHYLTNNALRATLASITSDVLNGSPLALMAFDTCMGAMFETACQVAPYAHYLVGSQTCSLPDGFNYQGIMAALNADANDPRTIAEKMVQSFDAYYAQHDASGIYTHSACDLQYIEQVQSALNNMLEALFKLPAYADIPQQICALTPRFCLWPQYTDLISWWQLLLHHAQHTYDASMLSELYAAHVDFQNVFDRFIVATCSGKATRGITHGCAIYCPWSHIDRSYHTTIFAQTSYWVNLLQTWCMC